MNKKINEILTTIRKEHKLTRPDIERIAGFKVSTIESYERGSRKPSIEYIEFISLYFGYKKEYIEGKSEDKFLDYGIKTLLMYQSIYNYDDKKMAELLAISLKDYLELLKKKDIKTKKIINNRHLYILSFMIIVSELQCLLAVSGCLFAVYH